MPSKKKTKPALARKRNAVSKSRRTVKWEIEKAKLTSEAKQRAAELAVITSVQKALADESDIQKIYDTVGEKLREIFNVGAITINVYDLDANTNSYVYGFEAGKRTANITIPINKLHRYVLGVANPTFLLNSGAPQFFKRLGAKAPRGKLPKSALSVKLGGKSKHPSAVVLMDIEHENAFSQNDVRLLEALANSMQVALENARLFDETNQRNAELAVITSVQNALAKELDLHGVYRTVGQKILKMFKTQTVTLRSFDTKRGISYFDYAFELGKEWTIKPYPTSRMIKHILGLGKPFVLNEGIAQFMKKHRSSVPAGKMPKSFVFVPYKKKGPLTGAITIEDMDREQAFSKSDVRVLESIANSLSVALENARLFDEIQKRNQEITETLEQQSATSEILRAMASSPSDLQPVLASVATNAAKLCEADDVQIYSVEGDRLKQVVHWGPLPALKDGDSLPLVKGLVAGRAVLEKRTIHTKDATKLSKKQYPESVKLQKRLGHRTVLATPLLHEGNAIGLIAVRRNIVLPFTDKQIALLRTFADQAAIAIENVRLFEETAQRNAELAVINSVQQGLASRLKFQEIIDLVGEKVGEIFNADTVAASMYDAKRERRTNVYYVDRGRRIEIPDGPLPRPSLTGRVVDTGKPLHLGTLAEQEKLGVVSLSPVEGEEDQNRSVLFVPILAGKRPIGVVSVQSYRENAFTENDLHLLQTLAGNMSVALENARLFDETAQRNAELALINSVQQGLAKSLKFQEIIDLVGDKVGEIFKADTVTAGMYDAQRDWVTNGYYVDRGRRVPTPDRPMRRPSLGATVLQTKKPVLFRNSAEMEGAGVVSQSPAEGEEDKNQSMMFVPILAGDRVIGSMSVQSYQVNAYNENDLHLLETLASSMSVALENARLFDETAQRNAELAVINSVQEAMAKQLDIKSIYEAVGEKIKDIFKAQALILGAFDHTAGLVQPYYFYENGERFYPEAFPFSGLIKHLIATRKSVVINEDFATKQREFEMRTVAGGDTTKSAVFIPLVVGNNVFGAFTLQDDRENAFSASDVRLLETVASSMSVALENARLFDETTQRNAELAVINSVQEGISSKLEVQAIYELVGEKLREVFQNSDVTVGIYDAVTDMATGVYVVENGVRLSVAPFKVGDRGFVGAMVRNPRTLVVNENMAQAMKDYGSYVIEGTSLPKSMVNVPLLMRGHIHGLLQLQDLNREHAFSAADIRLLETIAKSVSIALENARLFDETAQRNAELAVINSVQSALAKELNIQAIYEAVGNKIREIFDAQGVILFIYDPTTDLLHAPYMFEKGERFVNEPIPMGGFNAQVKRTGKSILINENWKERAKEVGSYTFVGEDPKSYLMSPIQLRGRYGGSILLVNVDHEHAFSEADQRLLETLANSMSVAMDNARLFEESNRLLEESRKKEAELTTINTVGQAVASEVEMDALIQLIGEQVQKIFRADISYVALLDKKDGMIHFPYIKGETLEPLKVGEGIVSQIISTGKPVHINRDESWKEAERNVDRVGVRAKSYLGVPIMAGRQAIGAISVQSTQREGRFNDADMHLLSTIAANVGAAIENARLFAEVARQKEYFETVFSNSPAAVVVVNFNGTVISWNPAAENLFGYTAQEAVGHDIDDLVAKDARVEAEARGYTRQFTVELGRVEVKGKRTRKDGSLVDVELKGLPISVDGEMVGFMVIYHDISEIEQARRAAEEANQAKSAFLANMSHELRTPLNAIIGFTRIVRRKGEEALPVKQIENLDKVLVSAEHLLGLINTILDIAKIEAGRMDLQVGDFDLSSLIESSLATTQPLVKEGVELINSVPAELPRMHSDQEKIHRILLNLLSNAAKFTPQGSIKVIAQQENGKVQLTVQDSGIGIAPENLSKIFEEFQQADNTTTRQYGGTGLGLSISRSLAQLLGGDLTVTSEVGKGSAFHLTVPIDLQTSANVRTAETKVEPKNLEPGKKTVLVIDDQPEMAHILEQNLEDSDYQVIAAPSGEEGLEKARSLHPYAITLDIMMPHKDGWQVLYELKNDPLTRDIPVIMLTIVDNKAMGLRLGASDYLVKPLSERSLLQALDRLAQSNGGKRPKKVMVVDDDPKVVDLVQQMLEGQGFDIHAAKDGTEGLNRLEQDRPDVILLDLLMPNMDGFQFIEEVQKRPALRDIPIIVLTAKSLTNGEEALLTSSVAGIIKKQGLGGEDLVQEIRKLGAKSGAA